MYNVCITHEYTRYTVLYNNPFYTVQVRRKVYKIGGCKKRAHTVQDQSFTEAALEALHMVAVNNIANLSLQIMAGLGHWKVYID